MGSLERVGAKSLLSSKSASGAAGKGMVALGGGTLLVTLLASLIPFVGVFGLAIILIVFGLFIAE